MSDTQAPGRGGNDAGSEARAAAPASVMKRALAVLVLVGFAGAGLAAWTFVRNQRQMQEYMTAREVLAQQVETILYAPGVLVMAARLPDAPSGNRRLLACVVGVEGQPCDATDPASAVRFAVRMALEPGSKVLAGIDEMPSAISGRGKLGCEPAADEACPGWEVRAWFWAECAGGAAACDRAARIHVRHQIHGVGALAALPASPPDAALAADPRRFARAVAVTP